MTTFRQAVRSTGLWIAQHFGWRLVNHKTGESLGRVFVFPWGGKLHVVGLSTPVVVEFVPQSRLTYWKQEIGFTTHPAVDFPSLEDRAGESGSPS